MIETGIKIGQDIVPVKKVEFTDGKGKRHVIFTSRDEDELSNLVVKRQDKPKVVIETDK